MSRAPRRNDAQTVRRGGSDEKGLERVGSKALGEAGSISAK
jgi:hypothetical protein